MVSLKVLVAVMATFSLAEAYYKHDDKKKYSCSDTCASEMRLIKGYEEDCYQFLAKVVPGSVGHPSKVPKQYKYICSGTIDFVNACYCLAPEEPDYATDKHVKDINGRYANDEYVNNELFTNELFTNELFTNERFNDERVNNNRFNNERPSNERANNGRLSNDRLNNDSVNSDSVNNEDDPTAARDTVFIPQTVSTTTTEPTTTTTTESTTSITIEATTSTTTESITITTTESTTATTESTTTTTESTTATVTAIIAEANCPTCPATCDSPFTCGGTMSYCNGGNTCICFGTTEGGTICALSSDCLSSEQCTSSKDCPAGQKCISQNCCGFNVCVAEATNEQCDPAS
ncbi:hypothetical protein ACHAPZ_009496 [Fusarium culmorum]